MKTSLYLERLTITLYRNLGILMMTVALVYQFLTCMNLLYTTKLSALSVVLSCILTASFSFLSIYHKKVRPFSICLYFIAITIVSTLPYIKLHLLYLIPFILIIHNYKLDAKSLVFLAISGICYAGAVGYREYLHLIEVTTKEFDFVVVGFSTGAMFLVELVLIYWLFCPFINVLIDVKSTNKSFEDKVEKSSIEVLQFCSTAMSYHNKYLSVHIKGVEKSHE